MLPYEATTKRSGAGTERRKSESDPGCTRGIPSSRAATFTGGGVSFKLLPAGLSSVVTTKTGLYPACTSFSKTTTPNSEVPKNTNFIIHNVPVRSDRLRRQLHARLGALR